MRLQLQYWSERQKPDTASVIRTVGNKTSILIRDLEGRCTYYVSLRAYNSAGVGPQSTTVNVTTKKPRKHFHYNAANVSVTLVDFECNTEPKRITSEQNNQRVIKPSFRALKTSYRLVDSQCCGWM